MKSHKLTTLFYLIESPNYLEKYIGLTTRTLQQRFNEHKKSKEWIIDNSFSIKEIDRIEHDNIYNLVDYLRERDHAANREIVLIASYSKDNNLQNISEGGEWGSRILWQIKQEKWVSKYGSIEGFIEYKHRESKIKRWLSDWVTTKKRPQLKKWLNNWIKTDFKGGKKNKDLWLAYHKIAAPFSIHFHWVKGHSDNPHNNRCDVLATEAADNGPWKIDEIFELNEAAK